MIPRALYGLSLLLVSIPFPLSAETKTIIPDRYYDTFSQAHPPVGRIQAGDRVITKLLDSRGHDHNGRLVIYADNVLTGPFFVEGAEPGDTLVVHLDKVRLNRNWGWNGVRVGLDALSPRMVEGIYSNECCEEWLQPGRRNALKWDIDLERRTVRPSRPLGSKVNMEFPARPAIGCVGVAPPQKQAISSGPTGPHGGNIDYNGTVEGTLVYLPVFEPGALLFLGDGHATHGEGELLGNGTETSLDVEFSVSVIKGRSVGFPRLEEPDHLVTFGTTPGAIKAGFQGAISEMISWLISDYGLEPQEAHVLLGMAAELHIAAWNNTFICRLAKERLPERTAR
jgi:acetamidase/formamidase